MRLYEHPVVYGVEQGKDLVFSSHLLQDLPLLLLQLLESTRPLSSSLQGSQHTSADSTAAWAIRNNLSHC